MNKKRRVGQHWLEVALERIRAGEDEKKVLADYGYEYISPTQRFIKKVLAAETLAANDPFWKMDKLGKWINTAN